MILKNKITWRDDLGKVLDEFYQNSNVLLDLEKPMMTLLRKALITSVKWLVDEGFILVKRRSNKFGSFFKWILDLTLSCQVVNVVVRKDKGMRDANCNLFRKNLI